MCYINDAWLSLTFCENQLGPLALITACFYIRVAIVLFHKVAFAHKPSLTVHCMR